MGDARRHHPKDVKHNQNEGDVGDCLMDLLPEELWAPLTRHAGWTFDLLDYASEWSFATTAARLAMPVPAVAAIMIRSATIIAPPAGLCPR